ncbi:ABC transporter CDR4 [Pyrenophora seminiperda CCB06]|uniref:ABC transporter CDR4 n=1 Tax=Pyrenophora seminiperda CCB06 TaxID=1302712 RepID=A0A3M7MJL3_9PLEO|nr:ABC transporter CDR4 [Pyrenophora seminiperda CCB06]
MSLGAAFPSNFDREAISNGVPPPDMASHFHDSDHHQGTESGASTIAAADSSPSHQQINDPKDGSYNTKEADDIAETARREEAVHQLARRLTSQSQQSSGNQNPFNAAPNSALDPHGDNFNARAWTKAMLNLQLNDENAPPVRTAGISFRDLNVHGFGTDTDYQKTVGNIWLDVVGMVKSVTGDKGRKIDILQNCDGLVESGEMLVVLGPPGSGCSTFLKTITGETHGFFIDEKSQINYQGISPKLMHQNYRGEAIYTAEVDVHFPAMTVGETLYFAALARRPRIIPGGVTLQQYAEHQRDVIMALFGISHTVNTRVGNDFIRGVSGGERKRVTIAEASLSRAPLQAWDNSTRGLDSANAIEFCKTLRMETEINGTTACVAIYQAPQGAYDLFDKVLVLYEGRQIFFGKTTEAKTYFYPIGGEASERFKESRTLQKAKGMRQKSPYTLSYTQQVKLCLWRGFVRLKADPTITVVQLVFNSILALIISSVFYNLQSTTTSFYSRSALLFFAILMNAFGSALEILTLYAQRPIVEKHARYALYHPSAEAFASMLTDIPYKVGNAITFNLVLYFMTNLRREPGNFFFFVLISFSLTLAMSMLFRSIAALSRSLVQALAPAGILMLGLVMYTGFAIPPSYMLGWASWMRWINPVAYGFEALMINEFTNRRFQCNSFVPSGPGFESVTGAERACNAIGSVAGLPYVEGDAYINSSFNYYAKNKWRNFGLLYVFMFGFMLVYLTGTEYITAKKSKGEVLVFRRGHKIATPKSRSQDDLEAAPPGRNVAAQNNSDDIAIIERQTAIFQWEDVCYDVMIKKERRRILDHVDGWVKPGTLTALMGVSGAGKTTLLDCLATRTTMGVITGEMLVDGRPRDDSFQRKTGYAQQQDLHLSTSTVREALTFSAVLRQPAHISRQEKVEYVEEVIKLLEMEEYADAVVGVPGEGLNVEQRKRLTIGVELAAKPALLLFLDEPTSGLDSQTSWAILDLLDKLKKNGQAILCTIHQPSSMLFQRFDRLLFLAKGGRTVYFGEVGENSQVLVDYFVNNGSHPCPPSANPAEWMLEVIGAAPGSHTDIDWPQVWRDSPEKAEVKRHLAELKNTLSQQKSLERTLSRQKHEKAAFREFAAPFATQMRETLIRVFQQYWRTPSYLYSKLFLCAGSALYIGFSLFQMPNTLTGMQNQMFGIFMLLTIFSQLLQQMMPHFVTQRDLYEVRERPSKAYSWKAFMISSIIVELPYNALMAVVMYFCWYYPIGLYANAQPTDEVAYRGFQFFLFVLMFLLFTSTFSAMIISGLDTAETGGNLANLMFSLCLIFCGVLAQPSTFPRFWIFMYRVSPFTYLVSGLLSAGLANNVVTCAPNELIHFEPAQGSTCDKYMSPYISTYGGKLSNPNATSDCQFCTISETNTFLKAISSSYDDYWRNFGILWVYVIFNIVMALVLYWLVRMPKPKKEKFEEPVDNDAGEELALDKPSHSENKGEDTARYASITGSQTRPYEEVSEKA